MTGRELAWRIFANELRASSEEERATAERTASYVISPLGARMNRVLVAGLLAPSERSGPDGGLTFWRSRLTDPTGTVPISAGSFQPRAQAELRRFTAPAAALVMGKVHLFRGTSGVLVGSVRAEAVRPISEVEYRQFLAETALQTLERLGLVERLRSSKQATARDAAPNGTPPAWLQGARASVARYADLDPGPYRTAIRTVWETLRQPLAAGPAPVRTPAAPTRDGAPGSTVQVTRIVPVAPRPPVSAADRALEGRLLEILDELAEVSPDGYADMDELSEKLRAHGVTAESTEEILSRLEESRTIEEPIVGKFRRTEGPPAV